MLRRYDGYSPKIHSTAYIHDSAEIIGRVRLGRNSSVWPLAVLRGDVDEIRVGASTNIQDLTVIHCRDGVPAVIGDRVTVGHRVIIHGARIGSLCLIGMGAVVMEASIGASSLVAAGALVLKGFRCPPRSLVLGAPARRARALTAAEVVELRRSAADYANLAQRYARTSAVILPGAF